tara:strand:- start:369 stop:854 length:486 start_codon:yes stop_codon:yes gene_type:complete
MTDNHQPNLWGFDTEATGGKVGKNHPETSRIAAAKVKSGSQKAQIITALSHSPDGLTAHALSSKVFNSGNETISANQSATRLGELREQGLAAYLYGGVGKPIERETTPGNTGYVHVLTQLGNEAALSIRLAEGGLQSDTTKKALLAAGQGDRIWTTRKRNK